MGSFPQVRRLVLVASAAGLLALACGSDRNPNAETPPTATPSPPPVTEN